MRWYPPPRNRAHKTFAYVVVAGFGLRHSSLPPLVLILIAILALSVRPAPLVGRLRVSLITRRSATGETRRTYAARGMLQDRCVLAASRSSTASGMTGSLLCRSRSGTGNGTGRVQKELHVKETHETQSASVTLEHVCLMIFMCTITSCEMLRLGRNFFPTTTAPFPRGRIDVRALFLEAWAEYADVKMDQPNRPSACHRE